MTITDLLKSKYYRNNKSLLAKELNVYRATVALYAKDKEGAHHFVREGKLGKIELLTNQSNKVEK